MPERIYANTFSRHKSRSTEKEERKKSLSKTHGICVVALLSVLLFLSLLTNAVLAYLYSNQLMGCEPVTNNCRSDNLDTTTADVNKPSHSCVSEGLPEKWVKKNDRIYVFSSATNDWNSSRQRCQDLGGDLAIINSSEEQEFLAQEVVSFGSLELHWIGLTDHQTEGVWLWVDNTPLNNSLSLWIHPPDDHGTMGEDCAVLIGELKGKKWGDISCLKKERSICEIQCY